MDFQPFDDSSLSPHILRRHDNTTVLLLKMTTMTTTTMMQESWLSRRFVVGLFMFLLCLNLTVTISNGFAPTMPLTTTTPTPTPTTMGHPSRMLFETRLCMAKKKKASAATATKEKEDIKVRGKEQANDEVEEKVEESKEAGNEGEGDAEADAVAKIDEVVVVEDEAEEDEQELADVAVQATDDNDEEDEVADVEDDVQAEAEEQTEEEVCVQADAEVEGEQDVEKEEDEEETIQNTQEEVAVVQDLLLSRRTINDFETELPSGWEEKLERAIEAATYAPNHKRTEPWRFHLLGKKSIKRVCELNSKLVAAKKGKEAGDKKLKRWLAMPGWLVVTCVQSMNVDDDGETVVSSMDDPSGTAREDYAACCCAVQNLSLSLHADGMGTKWTTGPVNFDPGFAKAVGMPSDEYVVGTIWFGTPSNMPKPPPKRMSIADVLTKHD